MMAWKFLMINTLLVILSQRSVCGWWRLCREGDWIFNPLSKACAAQDARCGTLAEV